MSSKYFEESCEDCVKSYYEYDDVIISKQTEVQKVDLLNSPVFGKMLFLDGEGQSSSTDEGVYHEMLVHPTLSSLPDAKSVMIIGGGEGATLREVVKYKNLERILMIDYDSELVDIYKEHCPEYSDGAYDDNRVELNIISIWDFLEKSSEKFDVVVCDLNDGFEDIERLFKMISGITNHFVVQMGNLSMSRKEVLKTQLNTLNGLFKNGFRCYKVYIPFFQSEWCFYSNSLSGIFNVKTKYITNNFFRSNLELPHWFSYVLKS